MGALADKVRADMTAAMKAQEKERLSTLRMLQSSLKNEQINLGHELSDEEGPYIIPVADSFDEFLEMLYEDPEKSKENNYN